MHFCSFNWRRSRPHPPFPLRAPSAGTFPKYAVKILIGNLISGCGRPYDGPKLPNSASVQLAFRVAPAEVDACHAELLRKQFEIIDAPRSWDYGHRALFFKDPEGNILEIYADI
jgi:catechol 2,3-dioxygenase-like lactoylglutathione lyase family enzyme